MSQLPRLLWSAFAALLAVTSAERVLAQAPGGVPPFVPGELLIGFASGADRDALINQLDATRERLRAGGEAPAGLSVVRRSGSALKLKIEFPENIKVRLRSNPDAELDLLKEVARQLKASNPSVRYAHPNWIMSANPPAVEITPDVQANLDKISAELAAAGPSSPNDPAYQFGLHWHYAPPPAGMNAVNAWKIEKGSRDVVVAVLDTGFVFSHEDTNAGNVKRGVSLLTKNMCTDQEMTRKADGTDTGTACPASGKQDNWHGLHVAGTVGAMGSNNGRGIVGVAWNVTMVPVRVLGPAGSGPMADIADGIRWAAGIPVDGVPPIEKRADIINMSLGGTQICDEDIQFDIIDAIKAARAAGSVIVAAAGNGDYVDNQNRLCKPGSSPQCKFTQIDVKYSVPASCPGVISVAASDHRGFLAPYSNFGAVTITAPGGDTSKSEEYTVNGKRIRYPLGVWSAVNKRERQYEPYPGTSMAAPHVAGAIALALSKNPSWRGKPDLIEQKVRASAVRPPQGACMAPKTCGPGLLDAVKLLSQP